MDMITLESARHHLIEHGLLGDQAGSFGSPDELMLISAGPATVSYTHLTLPTTPYV